MAIPLKQLEHDYICCLASRLAYQKHGELEDGYAGCRDEMLGFGFNLTYEFDSEDEHDVQFSVFESDEEMIIAFRGTDSVEDLIVDLKSAVLEDFGRGQVGKGVKGCVGRVDNEIWDIITRTSKKVTLGGHSIGGAIASAIALKRWSLVGMVVTFGCPRTGDTEFTFDSNQLVKHRRYVNGNDIITRLPWQLGRFKHCGTLHYLTVGTRIAKAWVNPSWLRVLMNRWGWFKRSPFRWATTSATNHPIASYQLGLKALLFQAMVDQEYEYEEMI